MEEFTRQLEATLALAMQPDTAKVREATSTLEGQFYIHAQVFPALFHIIQHGSSLEVRGLFHENMLITRERLDTWPL